MEEKISEEKEGLSAVKGQQRVVNELKIITKVAKMKGEAVGHILLSGDIEKKRAEIALAVARELGVNCKVMYGNTITDPADIAGILNNLEEGDILLIEDFDKMRSEPKDVLSNACIDFAIDLKIGKGSSARNMRMNLPHFTLIATVEDGEKLNGRQRLIFDYFYELDTFNADECRAEIMDFLACNSFCMSSENIELVSTRVQSWEELHTSLKWFENLAKLQDTNEITGDIIAETEEHIRLAKSSKKTTH